MKLAMMRIKLAVRETTDIDQLSPLIYDAIAQAIEGLFALEVSGAVQTSGPIDIAVDAPEAVKSATRLALSVALDQWEPDVDWANGDSGPWVNLIVPE